VFIYFAIILRSLFAAFIGWRIIHCLKLKYTKPISLDDSDSDSDTEEVQKKSKIVLFCKQIFVEGFLNNIIWLRNLIIWSIKEKSSLLDIKRLGNKIIGGYLSIITFFYLRIMTTSFKTFGCDWQPNGSYTFKESPDINW
jgi:hypothetical protein